MNPLVKNRRTPTIKLPEIYSTNAIISDCNLNDRVWIGRGPFAIVSKAVYHNHDGTDKLTNVAIKEFCSGTLSKGLERDCNPYCKIEHEHIVKFIGVCLENEKLLVVTELMDTNLEIFFEERKAELSPKLIYRFALGILRALHHLHSKGIAHSCLKPTNVLLTKDLVIKVSDFGLTNIKKQIATTKMGYEFVYHVARWTPPEFFSSSPNNPSKPDVKISFDPLKLDMYSYGAIFWQLLSKELPYQKLREKNIVDRMIDGKLEKLVIQEDWPIAYRNVVGKCLSFRVSERPTAASALTSLYSDRNNFILFNLIKNSPNNVLSQPLMKDVIPLIISFLWKSHHELGELYA